MTDVSTRVDSLSEDRRALLERFRRDRAHADRASEPIAIVGMGSRFPGGANDPESYWRLLRDRVDATGPVPAGRWDIDSLYDPDPDRVGGLYVRRGGFLGVPVDEFDATFFGISRVEAQSMDPQQRLLLEVSWEALENAVIAPDTLTGSRTGVFVGIGIDDYKSLQTGAPESIDAYTGTGNLFCVAAGRLSHVLGLNGPSLAVDTGCSSSLVSVHLACQSLRSGESDLALAGGVHLMLTPDITLFLCRARALAPDGRCKTFDASADGYARGEGAGVIVLKRLRDAEADNDRVLAVIRGSAVNHDGPSSGLTVPSGRAQQALIRSALRAAGLRPSDLSYVEAHGTGTALGDPVEVRALGEVLASDPSRAQPLALGAVKTNIGHLEAAAGVAGLQKIVLALRHRTIPANLHFAEPNPRIAWAELPVRVPTAPVPWTPGAPRIAGVSSFGIGGTNAHVIVAESPARPEPEAVDQPEVVVLSARSAGALRGLAAAHAARITSGGNGFTLAGVAHTTQAGRARFDERLAVVADSLDEVATLLAGAAGDGGGPGTFRGRVDGRRRRVVFSYPGLESWRPGFGRELYEAEPVFRAAFDRCAEVFDEAGGGPLREIARTDGGPPALLAVQHGLTELWRSWGVTPAAVLADGAGALAAACANGVLTPESAMSLALVDKAPDEFAPGEPAAADLTVHIRPETDRQALLATLFVAGVEVDWSAIRGTRSARRVELPTYPFQRERYWRVAVPRPRRRDTFPGKRLRSPAVRDLVYEAEFTAEAPDFLADHALFDRVVVPGACHLAMLLSVARLEGRGGPCTVTGIVFPRALALPLRECRIVQLVLGDVGTVSVVSAPAGTDNWTSHATARFEPGVPPPRPVDPPPGQPNASAAIELRERMVAAGYHLGPRFQWITGLLREEPGSTTAVLRRPTGTSAHAPLHPALLDSCFQAVLAAVPDALDDVRDAIHVPVEVRALRYYGRPAGDTLTCRVTIAPGPRDPADPIVADAVLANADGVRIVDLDGIVLRRVPRALLTGATGQPSRPLTHAFTWHPKELPAAAPRPGEHWLLLDEGSPLGDTLAAHLIEAGVSVTRGEPPAEPPHAVVFLPGAEDQLPDATPDARRSTARLLSVLPTVAATGTRLIVVTRCTRQVSGHDPVQVRHAALHGLTRVAATEYPTLRATLLDLDANPDPVTDAEAITREFDAPASEFDARATELDARATPASGSVAEVAVRGGVRHVAVLAPVPLGEAGVAMREDGTYLITGGLGALGLAVAGRLVESGARNLVLVGRGEPDGPAARQVEALRAAGARVVTARADVADRLALEEVLAGVRRDLPPIRGVAHAAGVLDDGVLARQTADRLDRVAAPKMLGAWHLHELLAGDPLDFFALFSSAAALLGTAGQGTYAAANAFLDALAQYRRARGLPAVSIAWGPWAEIGMAARHGLPTGLGSIGVAEGLAVFDRLLGGEHAHVGVFPAAEPEVDAGPARESHGRPASLGGYVAGRTGIEKALIALWEQQFGIAPVGATDHFVHLGGDSIMSLQLAARGRRAGIAFDEADVFEHPTVQRLAAAIEARATQEGGA